MSLRRLSGALLSVLLCQLGVARAQTLSTASESDNDKAEEQPIGVVVELPFDRTKRVQELCALQSGETSARVRSTDTATLVSCKLPFANLAKLRSGVASIAKNATVRLADQSDPDATLECGSTKLELVCEGGVCDCGAYKHQYHSVFLGVLTELSGAVRGYNHTSVVGAFQLGYRDMAFEGTFGGSSVKIQSLPGVETRPAQSSWRGDVRSIFYGNGRNRAGFFIGAGFTYVPRDTVHAPGAPNITLRDQRTEWWLRSPFGIEVRFAVLGQGLIDLFSMDGAVVGRAFVEPWFPIGRLENEVTVMFGLSIGVLLGDRNDAVPYTK